ncbi:hypothetical protein GOM44_03325 [Wolbachia endosymbiont of Atemnus politus]|uniref:hypothetical protein n=1 Tax=Wolbachia endosymbiont of Atemnus politus TaxID=2682840 RepID=UPI0015742441|nr:hypothetical protein [Wolbachia endosymbiont of Atemnus politus]NSX83446.1 hypothetical protein [Wolbachia endosymbiont of Atemnus politus]
MVSYKSTVRSFIENFASLSIELGVKRGCPGDIPPNNVVPLKDERFNAKNAAATSTLSL